RKVQLNKDYEQLSEHLRGIFQSKVNVRVNEAGNGRITIPFDTREDMERILEIFDRL
ncbi:MAG TPA: chromosome partitioning protein ParB, partial [Bacteroidetes bacterium]|nr:chromosome partitioning protein ParB [Bacteroidota bacterium]